MAVIIPIIADVKGLTQGLAGTEKRLNRLGRNVSSLGSSLTRGLTLPIVALGAASIAFAADFNKGMANVATLIPGNTQRVEELKDGILDLGPAVGKSLGDLTDGLYQTISAFGDTSDTLKILDINARAATGGLATTTDAINLTSAVTKGYGDTTAAAVGKASDLALLTVRLGQTTFPELAASIGKVIPLSSALGVSQEELFATMATLTGVTGSASEVSTQMRGALQALLAPTSDATKAFDAAGIASGKALIKQRGFAGAVEFLTRAAEKSGVPLQKFISSIEGQTFALALTGAQADDYKKKLGEMGNALGTTDVAFTEATTGIGEAAFNFAQLKVQGEALLVTLGDGLAPALSVVLDIAKPLIDRMVELAKSFKNADPTKQKIIIGIIAFAAAIGPLLMVLGTLITTISVLIPVIAAISLPVIAVIAGIAALGVALVLLWRNSQAFRNGVLSVFETVRSTLTNAINQITTKLNDNKKELNDLKVAFQVVWGFVQAYVFPIISKLVETYLKVYITVLGRVIGILIDVVAAQIRFYAALVEGGRRVVEFAAKVGEGVGDAIAWFEKLPSRVSKAFSGAKTWLVQEGKNIVTGLLTGLGSMASTVGEYFLNKVPSWIREPFKKALGIASPSTVFLTFGKNIVEGFVQGVNSGQADVEKQARATFAKTILDQVSDTLDGLKTRLDVAKDEFNTFKDSVVSSITQAFSFGDAYQAAQDAGISFLDALTSQAANATKFAEQIKTLVVMGLSPAAIQQVLSAGAVAGSQIATQLIDGGVNTIRATNKLVKSVQKSAQDVGSMAAAQFYGAGVSTAQATVNGFKALFAKGGAGYRQIMGVMDNLAADASRAVSVSVNVRGANLPGRASGGPVSAGRSYLIGERGPEIMTFGGSGYVTPNNKISGGGGGSSVVYNLVVNAGLGTDPDNLSRTIVESIKRYEKRNGAVFQGPIVTTLANAAGKTSTASAATDFNRAKTLRSG